MRTVVHIQTLKQLDKPTILLITLSVESNDTGISGFNVRHVTNDILDKVYEHILNHPPKYGLYDEQTEELATVMIRSLLDAKGLKAIGLEVFCGTP